MLRGLVDNVLSGIKAGFKAILNYEHTIERKKMDNQKSSSKLSATLLALILGLIVLWTGSAAVAAEKKYVTDPSTGKVVSAPEYGGTLTHIELNLADSTDTWFHGGAVPTALISTVLEKPSIGDWGIDREEYAWQDSGYQLSHLKGALAESWEQTDPLTYIINVRCILG